MEKETPSQPGKEMVATLRHFAEHVRVFLDSQPPANDLDLSSRWLEELSATLGRWAQMNGLAESIIATLHYDAIRQMDEEEFKRIKNSSTAQEKYIGGMYPNTMAVCREVMSLGYILRAAGDNTRTLISSYRLEREIESRTQVRQTAQN